MNEFTNDQACNLGIGKKMTRFKELARIERAMRDGHDADLRWALSYCRSRIECATNKRAAKYWAELSTKVEAALTREIR